MFPQSRLRVSDLDPWLISNASRYCELSQATPPSTELGLQSWKPDPQRGNTQVSEARVVSQKKKAQNNGLHQTGRGGVAHASRRGPVVEARPAGEAGCCAGRRW